MTADPVSEAIARPRTQRGEGEGFGQKKPCSLAATMDGRCPAPASRVTRHLPGVGEGKPARQTAESRLAFGCDMSCHGAAMSFAKASDLLRLAEMAAARHYGIALSDIEAEFGVDRRTAQRMTKALEDLFPGTETTTDDARRKYWRRGVRMRG